MILFVNGPAFLGDERCNAVTACPPERRVVERPRVPVAVYVQNVPINIFK
jgi:hypothetical protein